MMAFRFSEGGADRAKCALRKVLNAAFLLPMLSAALASEIEDVAAESILDRTPVYAKIFIAAPSFVITVDSPEIRKNYLLPNIKSSIGLAAEWERFGVSLSVPFGERDHPGKYGRTSNFDLQLRKYWERAALEFYLQSYRGYYLKKLPSGCRRGDPCSLRPELSVQHAGVNAHYVLDSAWSILAAFGHSGYQKKSAGSWIISADFNALILDNDGPLQPGMDPSLDGGRFVSGAIVPGYGHTWVRGPWFVSPVLRLGIGVMHADYSVIPGDQDPGNDWLASFKVGLRLSGGYSGKTWRTGIQIHGDALTPVHQDLVISSSTAYFEMFLTRHF